MSHKLTALSVNELLAGESGNILIHNTGNRLHSYEVLEYSEGRDSFYSAMQVDLTQPRHKVPIIF